jgi:hypothetical protein
MENRSLSAREGERYSYPFQNNFFDGLREGGGEGDKIPLPLAQFRYGTFCRNFYKARISLLFKIELEFRTKKYYIKIAKNSIKGNKGVHFWTIFC